MRITSFWAKGYRSLRDVRIDNLGPFNIFYGPNGGGKSNILQGIRVLLGLARVMVSGDVPPDARSRDGANAAILAGLIHRRDLCARDASRRITLGAQFALPARNTSTGAVRGIEDSELCIEVILDWIIEHEPTLSLSRLDFSGKDIQTTWQELHGWWPKLGTEGKVDEFINARAFLIQNLPRTYGLISADRFPRPEQRTTPPVDEDPVAWHLREGRLKNALLAAQVGLSHEVRRRFSSLRTLLSGKPLHRPPFQPIQDQHTGIVDLFEQLPEPNPQGIEIPIDLSGLGIAQIYSILAGAMLMNTRAVGIEEPEAHLHAPTRGRDLRQLLVRLVEEKHIDQLFIATHSNLFDLDPTGYFDVSLEDGSTVVKRAELTQIDRDHLYEPGPAKHALERLLRYAPEDEIVFRRGDGSGVTAKEMQKLLQEDDAVAVSFLQDIHGAAVRMVKVQAQKPEKR